jgi:hypothetical protein
MDTELDPADVYDVPEDERLDVDPEPDYEPEDLSDVEEGEYVDLVGSDA